MVGLAGLLAVLTGCMGMTGRAGLEATPEGFGGTAQVQLGPDGGEGRVGYLATMRAGGGYGEGGFGLETCRRTPGWQSPMFCGRLAALELGSQQGAFSLGLLSPAVSVGGWLPLGARPEPSDGVKRASTEALEFQLSLGLHVRPLRSWQGTTPYLSLTMGGGTGASWY